MSDLEVLWAVLAGLYVWECLCWAPREAVAFLSRTGKRWRMRRPPAIVSNKRGGFILGHVVPPLGYTLLGHPLPMSLARGGVLSYVSTSLHPLGRAPEQSCVYAAFDDLNRIEAAGRKVMVNGRMLLKAASQSLAFHWAETLRRLKALPVDDREGAIREFFASSLDVGSIHQRWATFQQASRSLRWLCHGLFGFVFGMAPLAIHLTGLQRCWPFLAVGLLALTLTTALTFRRAHRVLYPEANDERFTQALTILLAPTSAIRAVQTLSKPLLDAFHLLAIAATFCSKQAFEALVRSALLDLRYPALPVCPIQHAGAVQAERHSREAWWQAVEAFLRRNGLDLKELLRPPVPTDPTCQSYCPRCRTQFVCAAGQCTDCGGLALVALDLEPIRER